MRASRLLSILMLLQTRGRISAPMLAAELEVSQRTILRDIDHLSAAGVPIWSDRGRDGGFQLREGWSTNLTGLTENEAQALFLSGMPSAAAELGLGSASVSARLKMLASLPDELRENAEQVNARLHFDPIDWFRAAVPTDHLQAIAHCVWHQRMAAIEYESWNGTKQRLIKPLGLVLKAGIWYTAALADESKQPRTYRLSNIHQLSMTGEGFRRPKKFDLAAFWKESTTRFETEIYRDVATIRVTKRGMKRLLELSAAVGEAAKKRRQAIRGKRTGQKLLSQSNPLITQPDKCSASAPTWKCLSRWPYVNAFGNWSKRLASFTKLRTQIKKMGVKRPFFYIAFYFTGPSLLAPEQLDHFSW